jgi:hypothetical protein
MTMGTGTETRYGAHRMTPQMRLFLFPEKQAPEGYDFSQYERILGLNTKNNIAIVSSTPGSVSTVRKGNLLNINHEQNWRILMTGVFVCPLDIPAARGLRDCNGSDGPFSDLLFHFQSAGVAIRTTFD